MGIVSTATSGESSQSHTQIISRWHLHHTSSPPPLPGEAGASDDHTPLLQPQQHWSSFDSSVNAVSFGFVATAILISMFLVMAIFERFLRPASDHHPSSSSRHRPGEADVESGPAPGFQQHPGPGFNPKLGYPSPKMTVYTKGVSVLMPGEEFPTFIAHPVPVPCPPERISWPIHHQNQYWNPTPLNPNTNSSNRRQDS